MYRKILIPIFVMALTLAGCNKNEFINKPQAPSDVQIMGVGNVHTGTVVVKFKEEPSETKSISNNLSDLGISSFRRLFTEDPRFSKRYYSNGLNLWYVVSFDREIAVTKAQSDLSKLENVELVEYMHTIVEAADSPFNDPFFSKQWHYHNTAPSDGYLAGADINLVKAWGLETGDESVIVAILDSGVEYSHEDLADAMWVNEAEKNGTMGEDDDNNGFQDDIHGFNFAVGGDNSTPKGIIKPYDHGTHVAGVVGAVNNNGKFGSGVAGGNGTKRGVRLMTCQTIDGESGAYIADAFHYAANNGAVISQNSWSLRNASSTPEYMIEAIDYFNTYAGLNADSVQVGPMHGGVTIFAAGNDNLSYGYPSMYEGNISVSATGPSGMKASYSSFGSWVDISAPGGENGTGEEARGNVMSTITGNNFGAMSGTSMACPHVSGVAALIVSKYGGHGFTNQMLRDRLLSSADSVKLYSVNPSRKGLMGKGMVDAYAALYEDDATIPTAVGTLDAEVLGTAITIKWKATQTNGKSTFGYYLYYSEGSLAEFNSSKPSDGVISTLILGGAYSEGATISHTIKGLKVNTKYHFRVEAVNASNIRAALSPELEVMTEGNAAPVISPSEEINVTLRAFETAKYQISISDPNEDPITYSLTGETKGLSIKEASPGVVEIVINATKADPGQYSASLVVTDSYQASTTLKINYTVLPNNAPTVAKQIENTIIGKDEVKTYDLNEYFSDTDGENLTYTVNTTTTNIIVEHSVDGNILSVKGKWYGMTTLVVTATDAKGESASVSFDILMRDNDIPLDIYPNPIQTTFQIRTDSDATIDIKVTSVSGATAFSATGVAVGPFAPYTVDATNWEPGNYSIEIKKGEEITRRNIVKL